MLNLFMLQVVQETKNILQGMGHNFEFRGSVQVKGKGELVTYYLLDEMLDIV